MLSHIFHIHVQGRVILMLTITSCLSHLQQVLQSCCDGFTLPCSLAPVGAVHLCSLAVKGHHFSSFLDFLHRPPEHRPGTSRDLFFQENPQRVFQGVEAMTSACMGHRMGDFGMYQAIASQIQVRSLHIWQPEQVQAAFLIKNRHEMRIFTAKK